MTDTPAAILDLEVGLEMVQQCHVLETTEDHVSSRLTTLGYFEQTRKPLSCLSLCYFGLSYHWKLNLSLNSYVDDLPSPLLYFSMPCFLLHKNENNDA